MVAAEIFVVWRQAAGPNGVRYMRLRLWNFSLDEEEVEVRLRVVMSLV